MTERKDRRALQPRGSSGCLEAADVDCRTCGASYSTTCSPDTSLGRAIILHSNKSNRSSSQRCANTPPRNYGPSHGKAQEMLLSTASDHSMPLRPNARPCSRKVGSARFDVRAIVPIVRRHYLLDCIGEVGLWVAGHLQRNSVVQVEKKVPVDTYLSGNYEKGCIQRARCQPAEEARALPPHMHTNVAPRRGFPAERPAPHPAT